MNQEVINDLFDYGLKIYQNKDYFKFSLDSILLAEYVTLKNKDKNVLDMCTGNAAIPLILSTKYVNNIVSFEIQKEIYDLAVKSIQYNKLENKIKVINDDVKMMEKYFPGNIFDVIICNPPYFKYQNDSIINKNNNLSLARHEITLSLEDIFLIANKFLKDNGIMYLSHQANRLDEIIILANKYKLNVKEIQLITTKYKCKPKLVLIKCVKNSKLGVIIKPVININGLKTYKNIFGKEEL